jgi:hypothetical protein
MFGFDENVKIFDGWKCFLFLIFTNRQKHVLTKINLDTWLIFLICISLNTNILDFLNFEFLFTFDLFIKFRFIYLFSICLLSIWFLILMYIFNLFWISRIRFLYFIQISNHFSWSFDLIFLFDLFGIVYCYFCNIYFDFCLKFWNDLNLFCILKSFSFAFSLEYDIVQPK